MDSWEGIGPHHFYTTGTTYHRWSSERSRFWGLTGISAHRHFERGFGASGITHPRVLFRQHSRAPFDNLGMTIPRQVVPGCDYIITRRCSERRVDGTSAIFRSAANELANVLGQGANQARVTPARAVARAAFAALVSGPAAPREVPGFDIAIVPPPSVLAAPTLSGQATVVHRRTGETVRLAFSAQHDGRAGFKCKVGNERLTLADLDPDAASAVRVAALPGLAEQATTTAGAQALLDTADLVEPLPNDEAASLGRLFTIALTKLLENSQPGSTDKQPGRSPSC